MKYVILADSKSDDTFKTPRQLTEINGETLLARTVRLLKENGIKDILITSHDERFKVEGATRYEPLHNDYDSITKTGYWLSAFPIELLNEPLTFVWGDVYFSENAIKTIVQTEAKENLFFCTYKNQCKEYIKKHDEPLAYKVVDYELFKKHIDIVKKMYDDGLTVRHPIVWELYRSMNGQDVNKHEMTKNYIAINDESCDIDGVCDIILMNLRIGGKNMVKCEVIREFTLGRFGELKNIQRKAVEENGRLFVGDIFECEKELADYLTGNNIAKEIVVKVLEIKPEKKEIEDGTIEHPYKTIKPEPIKEKKTTPKTTRKKRTKKL